MTVNLRRIVRRSVCVCHPPATNGFGNYIPETAREILLRDGSSEWEHADDATLAATWHAHVERDSRDCDGGHGNYYVMRPNEAQLESEFDMWMQVVELTINSASPGGTLTTETIDGRMRATWSAPTDEGYEHEVRTMCVDPDCAYDKHTVYDQYAEAMGY